MSLEEQVLEFLAKSGHVKAHEIASHFGLKNKSEINPLLYKLNNAGKTTVDEAYRWSLATAKIHSSNTPPIPPADPVPLPFELTGQQKGVIESAPTARLFVEAGPGTGKSESLVARLKQLLGPGGLNASEVLVLSFSVAAVQELKMRIERARAAGDTPVAFIDLRTFDSFASRFLRRFIASNELRDLDYDARILRATQELKTNRAAALALGGVKHVLLDEVQDLVGVRADFALELLRATKPGFTLFGDSAQGIYDFTIESGQSRTTSGELVKAIRMQYPDLDDRHRFTKNFRVGGNPQLENIALQGRTLLIESPDKARDFLENEFGVLATQGSTHAPAIQSDLLHGATCVVCRKNGQVLRLAGQLHEQGIPFQIARDRNEFLPPAWIARVFLGWPDSIVRRAGFLAKAQSTLAVSEAEALQLWTGLVSSFCPPKAISFSMADLRAALTEGVVMPEHVIYQRNDNTIQLSTIHRSKGREFANVIVVMNPAGDSTQAKKGEDKSVQESEPRVLFVALTRAKKSLHRMEAKTRGVWMSDERWIRSFPQPDGFVKLDAIQVGLARDVDNDSFAVGEPEGVEASQKWLLRNAVSGTPVELRQNGCDGGCPRYQIMVAGTTVGRMSANFGWALWHTLKNLNGFNPTKFPKRITGIWVKEITTAVGDQSNGQINRVFLTSGLWVTPTLEGLGHCEWFD